MAQTSKISKNNTWITYHPDGSVKMVVLYNTVIYESSPVREDGSRTILIRNGGYNTVTTQNRLNQIFNAEGLPLRYTRKGGGKVTYTVTTNGEGAFQFNHPMVRGSVMLERLPHHQGGGWIACRDSFVVLNGGSNGHNIARPTGDATRQACHICTGVCVSGALVGCYDMGGHTEKEG